MRARTVNEEVHFQRGQDPKTAMGLGIAKHLGQTGWFEGPKETHNDAIELIETMDREAQDAYDMNLEDDSEVQALAAADEVVDYFLGQLASIGWHPTDE